MVDPEATITRLAARQHRVVTRRQLAAEGVSHGQVDRAIRRRILMPLHRGVYLVGGGRASFEARVLAACWATGGLASHRTAAALFGLRRVPRTYCEVTVERRASRRHGVTVWETASLTAEDRTHIGVIPVVRLPVILVQLAAVAPQWLSGALDDALVRRLVDLSVMERFLERAGRGRPGAALLAEEVRLRRAGQRPTESVAEDDFVELHRRFRRPVPGRQHTAVLAGGRLARFDFGDDGYDIEIDGARWHAGVDDRRADRERDAGAAAAGVAVARITPRQIRDEPLRALALSRAYQLRGARPGR